MADYDIMNENLSQDLEAFTSTFKVLNPLLTLGFNVTPGEIDWNELRRHYRYTIVLCFYVMLFLVFDA